jgi:SSS family solute:Na+ symporter
LGLRWTRLNKTGALAALATAPLVSMLVLLTPGGKEFWGNPVIPATLLSLVAAVLGSVLTKPVAISRSEALALLAAGRVTDQTVIAEPATAVAQQPANTAEAR